MPTRPRRRTGRTLGWLLAGAIVLVPALWAAWGLLGAATEVRVGVARMERLRPQVEERATTRLAETWLITVPFDGRLERIDLREGDPVSAGAIVARMDATELERLADEAEAELGRIDAEVARNEDASLENLISEQADALALAVERAKEAAAARLLADEAARDFFASQERRVQVSAEADAVTELELERARLDALSSAATASQSELVLRASEAILLAARMGPRLVARFVARKALTTAVLSHQRREAAARLGRVRDDLARAEIRAPVDGVVLRRPNRDRQVLPAGTVILEIGRPDQLEVEVELLSEDAALVEIGDDAEILGGALDPFADAGPASATGGRRTLPARVGRIHPEGFTKLSSLGVEQQRVVAILEPDAAALADLRGSGLRLGPGFRVRARIFTGPAIDAVAVPRAALVAGPGAEGWAVFVVRHGRAERRAVEIGLLARDHAEVRSGLDAGEEVILAPPGELTAGARVRRRE